MNSNSYISQIIEIEANAIRNIPMENKYTEAIDLIYEQIHIKYGKLVTSGMGKAGQIALNIATTFSSTGTPAIFLHPADAQHGDLGVIQNNDILLLISNSGKTNEILQLIELANKLVPNIPIIVITGNENSELASKANISLFTGNPPEVCPLGLTPTTSTTVMTVIGDILVTLMMKKINFTTEEYAKRHHSGYLGEKSKNYISNNNK
ncbi:MAG: SIS domain-containing protein [Bacteroidales bacterium]|nr:SIS domain-containing protein [Bacteroidales bacterium]